jgi:integrase
MGRHKLPYNMKKPNEHHKYWRYVLSTGKRTEISTRTKVKYEAERIAKEAYQASIIKQGKIITFGEYSKGFFLPDCKLTLRRQSSKHPISPEILGMKRGQLVNHLQPKFGPIPLNEITQVLYEDWRQTLPLANSTKNDITVVINQIMKEAVRDEIIKINPIQNVESLSKIPEKPRDSLSASEVKKLFPVEYKNGLRIWETHRNYTLMLLLVTSGMRSGEARALKWEDVIWDDSGLLITKAMKDRGEVGCVKENREKFVRLPHTTMQLLEQWRKESKAAKDDDYIFYGRYATNPLTRSTIRAIFKRGLREAKINGGKNLVPHSLRHTFNSFSLGALPPEVVRRFTGHSSEQMSRHYYHPLLKQELKATQQYQDRINKIWE